MAKTILGYEVASPEQQRKTALALFGFIGVMALVGVGVLFLVSQREQAGRQQAVARIISADTKCRYVVRNIGKRVSYYDHTGYIGCPEAHAVAKANDHALGSVQRRTIAQVDFKTENGERARTSVTLHGSGDFAAGKNVEILYRTDNPKDAVEFNEIPLFGKESVHQASEPAISSEHKSAGEPVASPESGSTAVEAEDTHDPERRASENVADSKNFWIGFAAVVLMGLGAFWLIRLVYRLVKRVIFGSTQAQAGGPSVSRSTSIPGMGATGGQARNRTFGQR